MTPPGDGRRMLQSLQRKAKTEKKQRALNASRRHQNSDSTNRPIVDETVRATAARSSETQEEAAQQAVAPAGEGESETYNANHAEAAQLDGRRKRKAFEEPDEITGPQTSAEDKQRKRARTEIEDVEHATCTGDDGRSNMRTELNHFDEATLEEPQQFAESQKPVSNQLQLDGHSSEGVSAATSTGRVVTLILVDQAFVSSKVKAADQHDNATTVQPHDNFQILVDKFGRDNYDALLKAFHDNNLALPTVTVKMSMVKAHPFEIQVGMDAKGEPIYVNARDPFKGQRYRTIQTRIRKDDGKFHIKEEDLIEPFKVCSVRHMKNVGEQTINRRIEALATMFFVKRQHEEPHETGPLGPMRIDDKMVQELSVIQKLLEKMARK